MMTRKELKKLIRKHHIRKHVYGFGKGHTFFDDQFVIAQTDSGWEVYYLERGQKRDTKTFSTEEEANEYFWECLWEYKQSGDA